MDRTGAPASTWLLCLMHVCFVLNLAVNATLGWQNPQHLCTGYSGDVSPLLRFKFWDPVYYKLMILIFHLTPPNNLVVLLALVSMLVTS